MRRLKSEIIPLIGAAIVLADHHDKRVHLDVIKAYRYVPGNAVVNQV